MKKSFQFIFGTTIILVSFLATSTHAQDCGCGAALAKDKIESSDEGFEKLYYLDNITKSEYEQIKNSVGASGKYYLIEGSANYTEFREKVKSEIHKTEIETGRQYKKSYYESRTSKIAYDHWGRCMENCNGHGLILWIQNESKNSLALMLKYKAGTYDPKTIDYTVIIQHGDGSVEKKTGQILADGRQPITVTRRCGSVKGASETNISVSGGGFSSDWVPSNFYCGNPPVEKTKIIKLGENEDLIEKNFPGIKNIVKIEIISFVIEERINRRPGCDGPESHGEKLDSPDLIITLSFGTWKNPECSDAVEGKWYGTGWHLPSGSCCRATGNKFAAVREVTVRVTYME